MPGVRRSTTTRRLLWVAATWVLVVVGLRVVVVLAEDCGDADPDAVAAAHEHGLDWVTRNQLDDGTFLYRYDRSTGTDLGGYNVVRHAGTTMALYQSADPALRAAADRGAVWLLDQLSPAGGGLVVGEEDVVSVGTTALLTAGLILRRDATGSTEYDETLDAFGRFMEATIAPSGAVLARWDRRADAPVPGSVSPFFTGEVMWALSLLGRSIDPAYSDAAGDILAYIADDRDEVEGYWPPMSDHWAAYAMAELAAQGEVLTDSEIAYARRQAQTFGMEFRWDSQRTDTTWNWLIRGPRTSGASLGTLGEGITNLWILSGLDDRLVDIREPLAERGRCLAGQLAARQVDDTNADDRARGAWFFDDVTQVDDQQHAASALLLSIPMFDLTIDITDLDTEAESP